MTNEIVSRKIIQFGKAEARISIFEGGCVLLVFNTPGLSASISGTHQNLVELRDAISEVLGRGV